MTKTKTKKPKVVVRSDFKAVAQMHVLPEADNKSVAHNLKREEPNQSKEQPIQRVIRRHRNGPPMNDFSIRLASAFQGWNAEIAAEIIINNTDEVDITWNQVVNRVNEAIMMENVRRRDAEIAEQRRIHRRGGPSSGGGSASLDALVADQAVPLLPPAPVMNLASGPLAVAGRSTAAMGAVAAGPVFKPIYRPTFGSSADAQVWKSGKASGPDDIRDGKQPNHPHSYHAEEKVVKSDVFRQSVWRLLYANRETDYPIDIWILINRSSCHGCTESLFESQQEVIEMARRLRIPEHRLRFNLSVLGLYTGGDDEDRRNLMAAGWQIHIHHGADGQLTPSGYRQVGRGMGDNDDK